MSVIVIATFYPAPGCKEQVLNALRDAVPVAHREDAGCELYALHEAADGRLVFVEKWSDIAALQAHVSSARSAALVKQLEGLLSQPIVADVLTAVPGGDQRGQL